MRYAGARIGNVAVPPAAAGNRAQELSVCTRSARPSAHAPRPRASECCAQSAWSTYRVVFGYRNLAVARRGQRVRERGTQSHRPTVTQGIRKRFRRCRSCVGVIANRIANPDERQATRPDDPTRGGRRPYPARFSFCKTRSSDSSFYLVLNLVFRARDSHKTPHDASLSLRPRRPRPFAEPRRPNTPPHKSFSLQGCASLQR